MIRTIKLTVKYLLFGISLGCTSFVLMCMSFFAGGWDSILLAIFKDFARQAGGAVLVGIACGGTAIVYRIDRLSMTVKILIHFCIGMGVFYPTAIYLGWIPFFPDRFLLTALQFLFSCGIFMAIWFCFYLFNRSEAKKINEKLRELEQDDTDGDQ